MPLEVVGRLYGVGVFRQLDRTGLRVGHDTLMTGRHFILLGADVNTAPLPSLHLPWWPEIDRNSMSSIGAPSSMIIATVTPGEGQLGSTRISLPSSALARSSTSKAT